MDTVSYHKALILLQMAVFGLISSGAIVIRRRRTKQRKEIHGLAPLLHRTDSGDVRKIERFSHYLARQLGFEDEGECPKMIKLGYEYLKQTKGIDDKMFDYLSSEPNCDALYVKMVAEFDRCILGYFAFHWTKAPQMISQVLCVDSDQKKLQGLVMAATRKERFEKITNELKVTRIFSTLVEEMKAIRTLSSGDLVNQSEITVPAVADSERSPVLLLIGGGMGAGKSTVLKDIMKESFWSENAANAVVVEADAFKETDVIYKTLSSRGNHHDMLQTAELVHQSSTDAASSLLVTALNEGRDVIMDGTLSWEPFVEQTIAMARNIHLHRYRMGEGYKLRDDGIVSENYWDVIDDNKGDLKARKPYRIELVGVICDPYLAVVRGIRRAIEMGRAVRVKSQLRSHKRFANAFVKYSEIVDNARLYSSNINGEAPKLIGLKDGKSKLLVDEEEIKLLKLLRSLNEEADSIYELYEDENQMNKNGSIWFDVVLCAERRSDQLELKSIINKLEALGLQGHT